MSVFFLIFIFTGILFLAWKIGINPLKDFKNNARIGTGLTFVFAGVSHFLIPDSFMKLMPPFIPFPLGMVYIGGVFEILGGNRSDNFQNKKSGKLQLDSAALGGLSGEYLYCAGKYSTQRFYE